MKRRLDSSNPESREILAAFVQPEDGASIEASSIRNYVADRLPPWMVPQKFVQLSEMPETLSGKPDFRKLENIDMPGSDRSGELANPAEIKIADLFASILKIPRPSPEDDFFSLGGDSLSTLELILEAERQGVPLTVDRLAARHSIRELAEILDEKRTARPQKDRQEGAIAAGALDRDARLPPDILKALASAGKRIPATEQRPLKSILLTGAAGFLASRLLRDLLEQTDAHIYCLVQAHSRMHGLSRLQGANDRFNVGIKTEDWQRVTPLCGDITKPHLGLSETEWSELASTIDSVHHCAAVVNMILPYQDLRAANVGGTENILRFALAGRPKQINYASTLSVFVATDHNSGVVYEKDNLDTTQWVYGGYAQTKWAAERLLRLVPPDILPINIFRFGLITGDVQTGASSDRDFLTMLVKGVTSIGCLPASWLDQFYVDVTPRNYSAAAMATISTSQWQKNGETFHIANRQGVSLRMIVDAMRLEGCPIDIVDDPVWQSRASSVHTNSENAAAFLSLCRGTDETFSNHRIFDLFQATGITFDSRNTDAVLSGTGVTCPAPTTDLIRIYVRDILSKIQPEVVNKAHYQGIGQSPAPHTRIDL